MLIDLVISSAHSVLKEEKHFVSHIVAGRKRFENWLQLEIYKRLMRNNPEIEMERPYFAARERCDFWCRETDELENWVELKLCVTNYEQDYTGQFSNRPITNEIDSVIADIKKLRKVPNVTSVWHVLLLAYPMPVGEKCHLPWMNHLDKIRENSTSLDRAFTVMLERAGKSVTLVGYKISA